MQAFELSELQTHCAQTGRAYLEFLRVPTMSAGLYVLPAGATDTQSAHAEDELYYVVSGRGRFGAGEDDRAVASGALLFVAAAVEHRFHAITEDLTVLVVFAPPEDATREDMS